MTYHAVNFALFFSQDASLNVQSLIIRRPRDIGPRGVISPRKATHSQSDQLTALQELLALDGQRS